MQAWDTQRQYEISQGIHSRPEIPNKFVMIGNRSQRGADRQAAIRKQRKARKYGFKSCEDYFKGKLDPNYQGELEIGERLRLSNQWRESLLQEGWSHAPGSRRRIEFDVVV